MLHKLLHTRIAAQLLILCCGLQALPAQAQRDTLCQQVFTGRVICEKTNEVLSFAAIYIKDLKQGTTANEQGVFSMNTICAGLHEVEIAQLGHRTLDTTVVIENGKLYTFNLPPDKSTQLNEVVIEEHQVKKQDVESLQKDEISGQAIDKTRGATLGESLKSITGVNSVQTGPSISKPMIHGMYGNRVLILNNGVRLEGQNWGADHAPEIDPFVATRLSVIKGAASIRYGTDAIAGVVLVDPKELPASPSMQGEVNVVGASNGRSSTGSGYLEGAFDKKLSGLSWRVQGTLRQAGSFSTPTYYLTNSGVKENNYSAALAYNKKNYGIDLFYSSFNTTIGIYSGSHVGNLTDLLYLFNSPTPLVPSEFSYSIKRGYQTASHHLFKAKGFYNFKKAGKLIYTFARQENKRSEFGEDLSYNQSIVEQNIPDAYFQLITHTSDLVFEHRAIGRFSGSMGLNFITQGNVFQGLDYRALIPNYRNYGGGAFWLEKWQKRRLTLEAGARYDYKWMRTYARDFTTQAMTSYEFNWQNVSGTLGAIYRLAQGWALNASAGVGWRPPAPIELFAMGIHQSAASFEIGDMNLKAERSYNSQAYLNYSSKKLNFEIGGYFNVINNYIYLQPLLSPVITVAGTFPAFKYTQANVYYTGLDANIRYKLFKAIELFSKTTLVYAYNRSINDYLIYVPANRYENGISFLRDSLGALKHVYATVSALVVSTQNHVPANSDYVPPPKGYTLLNADVGFSIPLKQQLIGVSFSVSNLLNTVYRDYLDRFRYYGNAMGRNYTLRLKIPFTVFKKANG